MNNIITSLPIMLYISNLLSENKEEIEKYLLGVCRHIKIANAMELVITFSLVHIAGYKCIYQYGKSYQNIIHFGFPIFGEGKIRKILGQIINSMLSWKLLLLQRVIVEKSCPELLDDRKQIKQKGEGDSLQTLDIDGISFVSFSDKREGSMLGHHRRYKGKPTLQGTASYIGKIFVDFKLFAGNVNVCTYFQRAIKRTMSMGYKFSVVRADTIYGIVENLLFLEKLSLSYVLGIRTSLVSLKESKKLFKKLARNGSSQIIHLTKGSAILDLGAINIAPAKHDVVNRRVILCRRIHRKRKKNGKWKIKIYFYAIVTDFDWSPRKIFSFYHQRQNIENAFKEIQHHYAFAKLCSHSLLKANEFWMITKIFAMTMAKIFAFNVLHKRFKTMYLRTIIRELFANSLCFASNFKVQLVPKCKYLWHIKRVLAKIVRNDIQSNSFILTA